MAVDKKLLEEAENAPGNFQFDDLVKLTEQLGWEPRKQQPDGSHRLFTHPMAERFKDVFPRPLNLQRGKKGRAKIEQVKEVLKRAKHMGLIQVRKEQD